MYVTIKRDYWNMSYRTIFSFDVNVITFWSDQDSRWHTFEQTDNSQVSWILNTVLNITYYFYDLCCYTDTSSFEKQSTEIIIYHIMYYTYYCSLLTMNTSEHFIVRFIGHIKKINDWSLMAIWLEFAIHELCWLDRRVPECTFVVKDRLFCSR